MLLIAGLGNVGPKYENNRHNVGFMAVDEIHRHFGFSEWKAKFQSLSATGTIAGSKVLLIKPTTFMNESGRAVGEATRYFKIDNDQVVVVYDELDLAPGKVRIKTGGGAGGHNGIRSIDAHIGKDYRRVRIGIGHPGQKEKVHGHVLGDFAKSDQTWLYPLLQAMADNSDFLVKGEDASFMNKLSLQLAGDEPSGAKGRSGAKGKSHIRQARPKQSQTPLPQSGPMADMLKKLFGNKDNDG